MKYSCVFLLLLYIVIINGCRRFKEEIRQLPPCVEAALCIHDGRRKCGFQKNNNEVKWFLDQCDILEFNCEYNATVFFNSVNSSGTRVLGNTAIGELKPRMNNTKKLKYFILTGDPGVGKTTLIKRICKSLQENGVKTSGFYTEEVRKNRVREGFDVISLNGVKGKLAIDQSLLSTPAKFTVGKYGILIQEFESIALPTLKESEDSKLCLVIDEIGKMEFYSNPFKNRVKEIFTNCSNIAIATIPIRKSDPLIEFIRSHSEAKVWVVTRANRNTIHDDMVKEILYRILSN